ncbi:MAG: adenylyl-sulfate kinase, partial [Burkholderiaceae bacterium]
VRETHKKGNLKYVEIYVKAPLEVCEQRDVKGLYKKARAGELKNFTGIDSPYEAPENAEIVIDTTAMSATEAAEQIVAWLEGELDYSI